MFKKIKLIYNDIISYFKKRRIKKSILSLFFLLLAVITRNITIIYLVCIIISTLFALKSFKKQKLSLILLIINILMLLISFIVYITDNKISTSNNIKKILNGKWEYNNSGGFYSFESNLSYVQYIAKDNKDNFCYGTYKYKNDNNQSIEKEKNYIYYSLTFMPKKCIVNGVEDTTKESTIYKNIVFGYDKLDNKKAIIIDTATDDYHVAKKIEE